MPVPSESLLPVPQPEHSLLPSAASPLFELHAQTMHLISPPPTDQHLDEQCNEKQTVRVTVCTSMIATY